MSDWMTVLVSALTALLGGGAGAALINGLNDRWKWKAKRKAEIEDQTEELSEFKDSESKKNSELDKRLRVIEQQSDAQSEALKLMLLDRILELGQKYIDAGEVSFDDRRRFHAMHHCYHYGLNGNGDADIIVDGVDSLQLKM